MNLIPASIHTAVRVRDITSLAEIMSARHMCMRKQSAAPKWTRYSDVCDTYGVRDYR
jgi:hypothetical protein